MVKRWKFNFRYLISKKNKWIIGTVSTKNGELDKLKTLDRPPRKVSFSPDGQYIAFDHRNKHDVSNEEISLIGIKNRNEIPLIEHPASEFLIGWSPEGDKVLFGSDRTGNTSIWYIPIVKGKPSGKAKLIKSDLGSIDPMGITSDGTFYYFISDKMSDVYLAELDFNTGKLITQPKKISSSFEGSNVASRFSNNGRYIAYISKRGDRFRALAKTICFFDLITNKHLEYSLDLDVIEIPPILWFKDNIHVSFFVFNREKKVSEIHKINRETGEVEMFFTNDNVNGEHPVQWTKNGDVVFTLKSDRKLKKNTIIRRDRKNGVETEIFIGSRPGFITSHQMKNILLFMFQKLKMENRFKNL